MFKPRTILLTLLVMITITAFTHVISIYHIADVPGILNLVLRWLTIAVIIFYAFIKKNLTTWILISMIVGAEFGYDLPEFH